MVPYYPPPDFSKADIKAIIGVLLVCCGLISLFMAPLHYSLIGAAVCVYFWPTIVAIWKGHNWSLGIFAFNAAFGWTCVFWLFALWLAVDIDFYAPKKTKDPARPSGIGSAVFWPEYNSVPVKPVQSIPAKTWIYKSSSQIAWEKLEAMVNQAKQE